MTPSSARGRCSALAAVFLCVLNRPAAAHLPFIHPQLVDLVQRSETILIGRVAKITAVSPTLGDSRVQVDKVLVGTLTDKQLVMRGPRGLVADERYVFFVRRSSQGFESVAPSGTIFAAPSADDARYGSTIRALAAALHGAADRRPAALRAALIPALSAVAASLRYHAALELVALNHDGYGPTEVERLQLAQLLAAPGTDPALRPLLSGLVTIPPPGPQPARTVAVRTPSG